MYKKNNTKDYNCQVQNILQRVQIKKKLNTAVVGWLETQPGEREQFKADTISHCAEHIGISNIDNVAHIVKADFCRERICNMCAWRRQAKFTAQTFPVVDILSRDYDFIFATLTLKNVPYADLSHTIDVLMSGYDKLLKRRKIKAHWRGKVRALEVTYNRAMREFHPHLHILVAVDRDYFTNSDKYISQGELSSIWRECISAEYTPICHIEKVTNNNTAVVETMKYTFKGTIDPGALQGFYYGLAGRRLVSFSGVFADLRRKLKYSSIEDILTDDIPTETPKRFSYTLFKFDVSGGVYKYFKELEYEK